MFSAGRYRVVAAGVTLVCVEGDGFIAVAVESAVVARHRRLRCNRWLRRSRPGVQVRIAPAASDQQNRNSADGGKHPRLLWLVLVLSAWCLDIWPYA